jgi:hypothetical protein
MSARRSTTYFRPCDICQLPSILLAVLIVTGCSRTGPPPEAGKVPQHSLPAPHSAEVIATIQELMEYEIDPAADALWGSVGSITTLEGIVERQPQTEDEWKALRRNAIVLMEATNLLTMTGRDVALVEFPSDGPGVYSSREIQAKLNNDRRSFRRCRPASQHTFQKRSIECLASDSQPIESSGTAESVRPPHFGIRGAQAMCGNIPNCLCHHLEHAFGAGIVGTQWTKKVFQLAEAHR